MSSEPGMSTSDPALATPGTALGTATGAVIVTPPARKSTLAEVWDLSKTIIYALLIAFALRVVLFQPFTIPSASMEPNLYEGDYIVVSKMAYGYSRYSLSMPEFVVNALPEGRLFARTPHRGDIVVFKLPNDPKVDYIKRLIGTPGDRIQVKGGLLYLNGVQVPRVAAGTGPALCPSSEQAVSNVGRFDETLPGGKTFRTDDCSPATGDADNTAVYTVPAGCYFMMGDNRDNSLDSRFDPGLIPAGASRCAWNSSVDDRVGAQTGVGFVPYENLEGKADIILLSWTRGVSLFKPWTWVLNARPSRFLHLLK